MIDRAFLLGDVIMQRSIPAVLAGLSAGGAAFAAYISTFSTAVYISAAQILSAIEHIYVTNGIARVWACATVAGLMGLYEAEGEGTSDRVARASMGVAFDVACELGAHGGH